MKHLRKYIRQIIAGQNDVDMYLVNLADRFRDHMLESFIFKDSGPGHLNCLWVTFYFIEWALTQGVPKSALRVLYIVEQKPETVFNLKELGVLGAHYSSEGEAHIMPAIGSVLLDPSFRQFDKAGPHTKITEYKDWKLVYGKFGYGREYGASDDPFYRGIDHKFDTPEEISAWASWMPNPEMYRPLEKTTEAKL